MIALLCLTLLGETYAEARAASLRDKQPLLVAVGAEWCPGCKKDEVILKQLAKDGKLDGVHFAHVDVDESPALARNLLSGTLIPQTVFYCYDGKQWTVKRLTGPQTREAFEALLK